jgi:mannose-6-phosphate isomerase
MNLYPLKLRPVLKDIIWGGTRLAEKYGKSSDPAKKIAESWELAIHKNGISTIENGKYAGKSLSEFYRLEKFPLLVKFIDAEQNLSVQVHPGDEYAEKHENESGKTEMWHIVDAKPGAKIAYGLNAGYAREKLREQIQKNKFEDCLNYIEVSPGDTYFIPAGLIHAIGEGILVLEIQQNSDATYRLYDYNRLGANNKPRELHIEKALDVCIKTKAEYKNPIIRTSPGHEILCECEYFRVEKYENLDFELETASMHCVICIEGEGKIINNSEIYSIKKGETYLLPAKIGKCEIEGEAVFIAARAK